MTSWDAFTGENFRRGGYLAQGDRYERARTFLRTTTELWDSWRGDDVDDDQLRPKRLGQPTTRVQDRLGRAGLVNRAENHVSHHPSPSHRTSVGQTRTPTNASLRGHHTPGGHIR